MENIHSKVLEIAYNRGLKDEDFEEFFSLSPRLKYDPFLLDDMDDAVNLIIEMLEADKKICIYGDYDADGVTASALLVGFFKLNNIHVDYYIPSRIEEGYGLNEEAIKNIHKAGIDLIITVDCGSVSHEAVIFAKSLGLEIIVTDHHKTSDIELECIHINPHRKGSKYPFADLSGCGVAFKLAEALKERLNFTKESLLQQLDLVAIGTIADVMPMIDENRTLCKYGLRFLNKGTRSSIKYMIDSLKPNKDYWGGEDIGFLIAPLINSPGRLGDSKSSIKFILSETREDIVTNFDNLVDINRERRSIQERDMETVDNLITKEDINRGIIFVYSESIHQGVMGIVAGRLKSKYNCPAIVATLDNGIIKGSGRCIKGLSLYGAFCECSSSLDSFGGHEMACGFSLFPDEFEAFRNEIFQHFESIELEEKTSLEYDMVLDAKEVGSKLVEDIRLLEPFGELNKKPRFLLKNISFKGFECMGKENTHCRLDLDDFSIIIFGFENRFGNICKESSYDILGTLSFNLWNNNKQIQFIVENMVEVF